MSAALLTAIVTSVGALAFSFVLGYAADTNAAILRHTSLSIFATLITLLSHSFTMFYLIGKGKAVREAAAEANLSPEYGAAIARARRPVFGTATLAIALTMVTAILGGGVDTGALPAGVHALFAASCLAANVYALRVEFIALSASARIVRDVNAQLGA